VYHDANDNGIKDSNEKGIANVEVDLYNSSGEVIAKTTTDGNGYYQFTSDQTVNTDSTTKEYDATFSQTTTDASQSATVQQFDPSLGTLTEVEIEYQGQITSDIKFESLDHSSSTVTGAVSGDLTVQVGGNYSFSASVSQSQKKTVSAYDDSLDFGGSSGYDFGNQTASGTKSITLSSSQNDLSAFIGTGTITLTQSSHATSSATGSGNIISEITSTSYGQIRIIYHYTPSSALKSGEYVIKEVQPSGYLDGYETSGNTEKINGSVGTDTIGVTLGSSDSTQNNFGEVLPSSLSGYVYDDSNGNGSMDSGEQGLSGVTVTLTGVDDTGKSVDVSTTTDSNGHYSFDNLRPGTYSLYETEPSGYTKGKDSDGNLGGTVGTAQITSISVNSGDDGQNYDFAEVKGGSLSGYVYYDANHNYVMDSGDSGMSGVEMILYGYDNSGRYVWKSTTTDASGYYSFDNLTPGTYNIIDAPPSGYIPDNENVGNLGGTASADAITGIGLHEGDNGQNYNFGVVLAPSTTPAADTGSSTGSNTTSSDTTTSTDTTSSSDTGLFSKRLFIGSVIR
jgi:hypothetical protein